MEDPRDIALLVHLEDMVVAAEVADRAHSTVITRVRLAHARSMYVRASALLDRRIEPVGELQPLRRRDGSESS